MNLKPTIRTLNPFAPEYNPIQPGVTPHPNAPLPSFLSPPSSAAFRQPPPPPPPRFLPNPVFTYIPSISHTAYYVTPARNPLPPTPPPQWRGSGGQRSWFPEDSSRSTRVEKYERGFNRNFKFEKRPNYCNDKKNKTVGVSRDLKFSTRSMQKVGKRNDQVMPLKRDEEKTTVMIKNIPYDCPRKELMGLIDRFCLLENTEARNASTSQQGAMENFVSAYDFLYLPIDFGTKKSRGFAFVNFTNATTVWKFFEAFHQKKWDFINRTSEWSKKIEVVTAKIQGKEALVNHFSKSIFECETIEYLPVTFDPARDGSGQPGQLTAIGLRRATNSRWERRCNHKTPKP